MRIFSISESQLDLFVNIPQQITSDGGGNESEEDSTALRQQIRSLWAAGQSRPEWCFVIEEHGEYVGRVAYVSYDELDAPDATEKTVWPTALKLPWAENCVEVGVTLLDESLRRLWDQGITTARCTIGEHDLTVDEQILIFESAGFHVMQGKTAYTYDLWQEQPALPTGLVFRSLTEVDETAFIDAIQQILVGTLDQADQAKIVAVGLEQVAKDMFETPQGTPWHYEPNWWQLAYQVDNQTGTETLVGVIQPLAFANSLDTTTGCMTEGTIGYIGVVPEQRGKGYINALLTQVHILLQEAGLESMYCDTDSNNWPISQAFMRAGYARDGVRWLYKADLDRVFNVDISRSSSTATEQDEIVIRTIEPDEVDLFFAVENEHGTTEPEHRQPISRMMTDQAQPEWMFVIEEQGQAVGRLAYRPTSQPKTVELTDIALPWADLDRYLDLGVMLIQDSLQLMEGMSSPRDGDLATNMMLDAMTMTHTIEKKASRVEERKLLMECAGFSLASQQKDNAWVYAIV
ncbi:MAG: hypothetical protein AAF639_22720 [Chloroflexota bacterium]